MESNIILYTTDTGSVSVQVQYEDGTFWLTQKRLAELFGVDVRTVNYHLKEIYNSNELTEEATIRKIRIVQQEGKRNVERELDFYHLKAILAVGVSSLPRYRTSCTGPYLAKPLPRLSTIRLMRPSHTWG